MDLHQNLVPNWKSAIFMQCVICQISITNANIIYLKFVNAVHSKQKMFHDFLSKNYENFHNCRNGFCSNFGIVYIFNSVIQCVCLNDKSPIRKWAAVCGGMQQCLMKRQSHAFPRCSKNPFFVQLNFVSIFVAISSLSSRLALQNSIKNEGKRHLTYVSLLLLVVFVFLLLANQILKSKTVFFNIFTRFFL